VGGVYRRTGDGVVSNLPKIPCDEMIAIENKDGAFRDGADLCGKPAEFFYEILSRQNNQVSHTAAHSARPMAPYYEPKPTLHSGLDKACEFPLMTWFFRIVHAARVFVDLGHLGLVDEDQEDLFAGEILPPHFISRRVVNSPSKISASASATNCASRLGLLPIVRGYCTHRVETAIRADTTGDTKTTSPL